MRWILAAFYTSAGLAHLLVPEKLLSITPDWVPYAPQVIFLTGLFEIAASVALLTRQLRYGAGIAMAVYAICVWPANIKHAIDGIHLPPLPDSWYYHAPRLALQPVIVWWALFCAGVIDWPWRRGGDVPMNNGGSEPATRRADRRALVAALLSFNGGFVDAVGYFGLQGLFIAHVTGNFVTLAAALVQGSHGNIGKTLALPEFVLMVALARLAGTALRAAGRPTLRPLMALMVLLLLAFCVLAVRYGPFPDSNTPAALLAGFCGIAAMAVQNAFSRVHFASFPPTTVMTNTTVQATLDAVDLLTGTAREQAAAVGARFRRFTVSIASFGAGCASAAILYDHVGFWSLALAVAVAAITAVLHVEGE